MIWKPARGGGLPISCSKAKLRLQFTRSLCGISFPLQYLDAHAKVPASHRPSFQHRPIVVAAHPAICQLIRFANNEPSLKPFFVAMRH